MWFWSKGRGASTIPGYSGVTLGLMHGSCPDALILCHQSTRQYIGDYREAAWLECRRSSEYIRLYETIGSAVHPTKVIGICLNTYDMTEEEARRRETPQPRRRSARHRSRAVRSETAAGRHRRRGEAEGGEEARGREMTAAIRLEGLVKDYAGPPAVRAVDGIDLAVSEGESLRPARPERRRQDHHRRHLHDARLLPTAGRVPSPASTSSQTLPRAPPHRCRHAVQHSRSVVHRGREPRVPLPLLRMGARAARAAPRAARAVPARRPCQGPSALSRGDGAAAAGGPRDRAPSRRPVPRRTDRRPRSAEPARAVGGHRRAAQRRRDVVLTTHYMEEADQLCARRDRRPRAGARPTRPGAQASVGAETGCSSSSTATSRGWRRRSAVSPACARCSRPTEASG